MRCKRELIIICYWFEMIRIIVHVEQHSSSCAAAYIVVAVRVCNWWYSINWKPLKSPGADFPVLLRTWSHSNIHSFFNLSLTIGYCQGGILPVRKHFDQLLQSKTQVKGNHIYMQISFIYICIYWSLNFSFNIYYLLFQIYQIFLFILQIILKIRKF